ncbi:MAG: AAA family ATPase [Clostridiales bacterium]|nr:AAA family ATPase [Clostridiales bacterium]
MLLFRFQFPVKGTSLEEFARDYYNEDGSPNKRAWRNSPGKVRELNDLFIIDYKRDRKVLPLIVDGDPKYIYAVASVSAELGSIDEALKVFSHAVSGCQFEDCTEIPREVYMSAIERAYNTDYLSMSGRSLYDLISLFYYSRRGLFDVPAFEIKEEFESYSDMTYKEAKKRAADIMASDDFKEELERIYSKKNLKEYKGHPVHYVISAGDYEAGMDMVNILVPALRKNKRLLSGRVTHMRHITHNAHKDEGFERLFESESGATVVVDFSREDSYGNMVTGFVDLSKALGKMVERYGKDTLFIFIDVSGESELAGAAIAAIQSAADMVHLTEGYGDHAEAVSYLKRIASRASFGYGNEKELTKYLPEKVSYTVTDIYTAYNNWYAKGLKSHVYKAYAEVDTMKITVADKVDHPYEELQKLVGLTDIKRVVDQIINTSKLEKMKSLMGIESVPISKHMCFTGTPGTCKTTVARLIAQILKEEGVLKNGHIVECGRQDLVARYVGWTAKNVEQKFREARGGILFIDEAYSLVDHNQKTFGFEAINAIVQLMENYRDEVIVIFAGYEDKMKQFLAENEGLNSRIAFHLNFPDYNTEELGAIMELMLQKQKLTCDPEAYDKCRRIFDEARSYKNFGNGRFVRNLLDQARLNQSARIMAHLEGDLVDKDEVTRLTAEDFTMPHIAARKSARMGL